MSKRYHTVCVREDGRWTPEFGSYTRSEVNFEAEELRSHHRRADIRIVTSGDQQADINAAVAHLNAVSSEVAL